jgi:hypothetical protein
MLDIKYTRPRKEGEEGSSELVKIFYLNQASTDCTYFNDDRNSYIRAI